MQGDWRGASSVLLTGGPEPILVDTGMPHDAHRLVQALGQRGLRPEDIRCVINTHFHLDHVSNNCLFPSSAIFATQQSYDWCRSLYTDLLNERDWQNLMLKYYPETYSYENAAGLMAKLRKIALRWWDLNRAGAAAQFRWLEQAAVPDCIEILITSGHVPGHASLIIRNGSETVTVAGDALVTRAHDDRVLTMIPQCRAQYLRDRERILSITGFIIPGHDQPFRNNGKPQGPGVMGDG